LTLMLSAAKRIMSEQAVVVGEALACFDVSTYGDDTDETQ